MACQSSKPARAGLAGLGFAASVMLAAGLVLCPPAKAQPAMPDTAGNGLGADVGGLLAASRRLSPALRAAALDTAAASAKAGGADALDDPTVSDSYTYYRDPGVFSAHTIMLSQAFPLWGKRGLRRQAALADVDAARGQERATQDAIDEKIKVAYAQYDLTTRNMAVNREIATLAARMRRAAAARYAQGEGDQAATILALDEETAARVEAVRLEGEKAAARARLNALVGRPADAALADPKRLRAVPDVPPNLLALVARARAANPTLSAGNAAVAAAASRSMLADKAWYPDITVAGGPLVQTNNQPVGFAATIGLNIPVPWGREAAGQLQAVAELGASRQRYQAAIREIEGALGEAIARLRAARATEVLLQREALPQAQASFQTLLADYSQGKGELTAPIAAERQIEQTELRLLQAQLDAQVELAAIERLIGGDL